MDLQPKLVEKLAGLARLELTPDEVERLRDQLPSILEYVGQLQRVTTVSAEPTSTAPTELRADQVEPSPAAPHILDQAPERSGDLWKVDAVFS